MTEVSMPQLGETVTEGTITRWFKEVGESVAEDEVLFEVSTDKVDSEVPSPVAGVLREILVPEGDTVEVGSPIAVVSEGDGDEGEAAGDTEESAGEPEASGAGDEPDEDATEQAESKEGKPDEGESEQAESKQGRSDEAEAGGGEQRGADARSAEVRGEDTGRGDGQGAPPRTEPPSSAPKATPGSGGGHVLSPLVRRLISEHGLDPASISGTGVGGRITRADVERVIAARGPMPEQEEAPAEGQGGAPAAPPRRAATPPPVIRRPGQTQTSVPLSNIRRRTGEHMVRSKATSAHTATGVEVDYENVERVRRAHRERFRNEEGFSLTYLPFIARAVVDAIEEFPHMNASVGDGELLVHHEVNLGIAVDLDYEGLLAPVVRNAEEKRLRAIAREVQDLAHRARTKQLSADDITGGTFTLTNAGSFGTLFQIPVISQPQVAILSTDGVARKPVVVNGPGGSEAIAIHSVGVLAMSWDHRAFDGAYAAAFLARTREIIETREWESEL